MTQDKHRVLVLGGGGREHALAWKIAQSPLVQEVVGAPGNPGIARMNKGRTVAVSLNDFSAIYEVIQKNDITLTVVGPEAPLVDGITDYLTERGCVVFGPTAAAARLEGSKIFAKEFMTQHGIPTAPARAFSDFEQARRYTLEHSLPVVIKCDGLAAGKGVTVAETYDDAVGALENALKQGAFGEAGNRVLVEEFMEGEEASILALCDGTRAVLLPSSQDHKRAYDGDKGPNTGGMGAYSPAPVVTEEVLRRVQERIIAPTLAGLQRSGAPYCGCLYVGLMLRDGEPRVVEYNCRFGDPETQAVLPRIESDLVPLLLAAAQGDLSDASVGVSGDATICVVLASGGYPGTYEKHKKIEGIEAASALPDITVFHAGTREEGGRLYTDGGRVLNVVARGTTLAEASTKVYAAIERIRFDNMHFRRDIGRRALQRA
jgi:phosphoribosylamine--glycine ligase